MSRASCLCGSVAWEIEGPFELMTHCHCSRCRKSHGTAFATYVGGPAGGFRLQGEELVARYESSRSMTRRFCGRCGSMVPFEALQESVFVPAGNFMDDPGVRPVGHIFAASIPPWLEIRDTLPRFDAYPPGVGRPVVPDRPPVDPPGWPRGSCACGEVAFYVEKPFQRWWNCHCSRCRKARSAAYAANLFTAADGIRFTRGEHLMAGYKVPDAKHFMQVFCRTCGSPMPRLDRERNFAIVPLGAMDDDPGIRAEAHIFTGSMAPWYTIDDDVPRYAEYPPRDQAKP